MLTAQEAANEVQRSKPAILKAIKTGRLSANKNGKGEWEIDPTELFRVYTQKQVSSRNLTPAYPPETKKLTAKIELLALKIEKTEEQLNREKEISDDLQKDRDYWRNQATNLLTDQRIKENLPLKQDLGVVERLKVFLWGTR